MRWRNLSARERRACLEALAHLSSDGAKGILTSRPNYFSEAEELQVYEVLYSSLEKGSYYLTDATRARIRREAEIDQLIESHILQRYERSLRDLSPEQTEALVERLLHDDIEGRTVVLEILRRVFRRADEDNAVSLSGKPVIISYLLEVVEQLKSSTSTAQLSDRLTEWEIYRLIVDQLMLRDLERSQRIGPDRRRRFLQRVAVWLSQREHSRIGEEAFADLVAHEFRSELRRLPSDSRNAALQQFVDDLRSSATLTRSVGDERGGWRFSHNSLREYLLAEYLIDSLEADTVALERVPVSDSMRLFVASRTQEDLDRLLGMMAKQWGERSSLPSIGQLLVLLWDGLERAAPPDESAAAAILGRLSKEGVALDHVSMARFTISSTDRPAALPGVSFASSEFSSVSFEAGDYRGSDFSGVILESCSLADADLTDSNLTRAWLVDADLRGARLAGAKCEGLDPDVSILVEAQGAPEVVERLTGAAAIGYLNFNEATTDPVDAYSVLRNHRRFPIVEKIVAKLGEQTLRQRRGLVQRGAARRDVAFAESFVSQLEKEGLVRVRRPRRHGGGDPRGPEGV